MADEEVTAEEGLQEDLAAEELDGAELSLDTLQTALSSGNDYDLLTIWSADSVHAIAAIVVTIVDDEQVIAALPPDAGQLLEPGLQLSQTSPSRSGAHVGSLTSAWPGHNAVFEQE